MKTGKKGQIGPMALEDIFPMTIAVIAIFIFIAYVYSTVGNGISNRNAESTYRVANDISDILYSRGVFIYGNDSGLFDSGKLDEYVGSYSDLETAYSVPGYGFSITVRDLRETERRWDCSPAAIGVNAPISSTPIAIRYTAEKVNEGVLEVSVWKK
jgi:hypothetical protein